MKKVHFNENVNYSVLKNIIENTNKKDLAKVIAERKDELNPKYITTEDIIASISVMLNLYNGLGETDDINLE